jgi:hypothetical protein
MAILASENSNSTFTPHPMGNFASVCCDVDDLGVIETTWQGQKKSQHKVDLWWYCGLQDAESGRPLLVRRRFTLSLAENSNLRPFLENWRGKKFTAEELKGFDLEKLIGVPCFLQVGHNESNGKTYANVDAIMTLPQAMHPAPALPAGFVRPSVSRREREAKEQATQAQGYDPFAAAGNGGGNWPPTLDSDDGLPPLPF